MLRVGQVECRFIDPCILQNVKIPGQQSEGDGTGDVDAGVLKLALDEEGDRNETACGGLGKIARPLVDSNGPDHLFGLGDLVHLPESRKARQTCGTENRAEE